MPMTPSFDRENFKNPSSSFFLGMARIQIEINTNMDSHKLTRFIYEEVKDVLEAMMIPHEIKYGTFEETEELNVYANAVIEELKPRYNYIIDIRVYEYSGEEPNGYGGAIVVGVNDENAAHTIKELADIGIKITETP